MDDRGWEGALLELPPGRRRMPLGTQLRQGPSFRRVFERRLPHALALLTRMERRHLSEPHRRCEWAKPTKHIDVCSLCGLAAMKLSARRLLKRLPSSAQPHLTFSEEWDYAFVERVPITMTREDALGWLDRRMRDLAHPAVPWFRRWQPREAFVVGLECWDEADGRRLRRRVPGSTVLWRVDISDALEVEPRGGTQDQRLLERMTELHREGRLAEEELRRARLLHASVEEAEAERRLRQSMHPPGAPRAPLPDGAGALLARLMVILMGALGARPDEHGDEMGRALRGLQQRLDAEEERQVLALRAELDARELG